MIRFLFRSLGLCLLALAFVFLVYDGTKSIANQQFVYLRVSELWADIDQHSLNQAQEWIKTKALWAWDPYAQKFFELPSWLVLAIISTFLVYARPQEEEAYRLRAGLRPRFLRA